MFLPCNISPVVFVFPVLDKGAETKQRDQLAESEGFQKSKQKSFSDLGGSDLRVEEIDPGEERGTCHQSAENNKQYKIPDHKIQINHFQKDCRDDIQKPDDFDQRTKTLDNQIIGHGNHADDAVGGIEDNVMVQGDTLYQTHMPPAALLFQISNGFRHLGPAVSVRDIYDFVGNPVTLAEMM